MADQAPMTSMPADATRSMFLVASGFGIGVIVAIGAFVFLVGIGDIGHNAVSPSTPAAQSAANSPTAPGPSPTPSPNTAGSTVPQTSGQAPAPANRNTRAAPTQQQKQQ